MSTVPSFVLCDVSLKEYETKGDNYVHTMIKELNKAFITPSEREDILQLTNSLDDVLDGIEHFSAMMEIFSITSSDEHIDKFSGYDRFFDAHLCDIA